MTTRRDTFKLAVAASPALHRRSVLALLAVPVLPPLIAPVLGEAAANTPTRADRRFVAEQLLLTDETISDQTIANLQALLTAPEQGPAARRIIQADIDLRLKIRALVRRKLRRKRNT